MDNLYSKNIYNQTSSVRVLMFLFVCMIFFNSCETKPTNKLVGTWQMTDYKSSQQVAPELKKMLDENIKQYVANSSFVFNEDSSMISIEKKNMSNGKWYTDASYSKLYMYDNTIDTIKVVDIVRVDEKEMVLRSKTEGLQIEIVLQRVIEKK